jgi:hypothetical protein
MWKRQPLQRDLFRYPVPKLSDDGACSLVEELADEPYDLSVWFGGETEASPQLADQFQCAGRFGQPQDWR